MSTTTIFQHTTCTSCGFDATFGGTVENGWFGQDSRCADCRDDADRNANGWTPENSID